MSVSSTLKWMAFEPMRSGVLAVRRKISALRGKPVVSPTCQVGPIREIVGKLGVSTGSFVEVGAFDGERFSNTSWLADSGWTGLYVEPSPIFARLCRVRHMLNAVRVANVAAGSDAGMAQFTEIGALSSLSGETVDAYANINWAKGILGRGRKTREVPIKRLDAILADNAVRPGFELLVVDVEGYEEEVFSGFDLKAWKPKLVIVELCDVHPDFQSRPELTASAGRVRQQILASGYQVIWQDAVNSIFSLQSAA